MVGDQKFNRMKIIKKNTKQNKISTSAESEDTHISEKKQEVETPITEILIYLADYNRFELAFKFNKGLIELIKTFPGRQYSAYNFRWSLPLSKYSTVLSALEERNDTFKIAKLLTQKEVHSIQIVILKEDKNFFYIQYPKNDEIKAIIKNFGGYWLELQYCWKLKNTIKEEFEARINLINIGIKRLTDEVKSKKKKFLSIKKYLKQFKLS